MKSIMFALLAMISASSYSSTDNTFLKDQLEYSNSRLSLVRHLMQSHALSGKENLPVVCMMIGMARGRVESAGSYATIIHHESEDEINAFARDGFKVNSCNVPFTEYELKTIVSEVQKIENELDLLIERL